MSSTASRAKAGAARAADSKPLVYLVRSGFICYGIIHLLLAWLALQVAFGHSGQESDQSGALQSLAGNGPGKVLLVVIAVGMFALAVWQAFEAIAGGRTRTAVAERALSGVRTVVYLWLSWTAAKVVSGAGSSSASNSQHRSSTLMASTGGRWLVGLVGLVVVGAGIGMIVVGVTRKFKEHLNTGRMPASVRRTTLRLGTFGYSAKGAAYGIAGVLVVVAAVRYDPDKARGLDAALKTLAGHAYGGWLLALIALGFAAFGIYCFAQAKYRKV